MIVMIERDINFIPVRRSIVRICLLSNSTNALLFVSISTLRTVPFESPNHTITHVVYSHGHTVLTWLKNSQTQNYRQQRRNGPLRTSNTEQNKAKFNLINTTTNTTSITKTFTYYYLLSTFTTTTFTTTTFTTTTFTTTTFTITTLTWPSNFLSFSRLVCTHSSLTCSSNA